MIIGLHGKMGAGKNEAARRLAMLSPLPIVEVSFAAKLKESAAALLGCKVSDLEKWKNKPYAYIRAYDDGPLTQRITVRTFLQRYGTEAHRDIFGQDFWLDAAMPLRRDYSDALYVVTDVRFPNEAQRVRELDGIVIGITGPRADTGSHPSELPLHCDRWIDNTARWDNHAALDQALAELLAWIIVEEAA